MNFLKRAYTVMELRTGFATGLPALSGGLFGSYLVAEINLLLLALMFIAGYCINIVANVANEIRAYQKSEEDEKTFDHDGSGGLAAGKATLKDTIMVLIFFLVLAGVSGLTIVFLTKSLLVLILGLTAAIMAMAYSIGPYPYITLPINEFICGLFCGGISSFVAAYIQIGEINVAIILYAIIVAFISSFLMAVNNSSDFHKDKATRVTLPHVIGFKNSIYILIPQLLVVLACWVILLMIQAISLILFMIGLIILIYVGLIRWYQGYAKINAPYPEMAKDWEPKTLDLIYSFNGIMATSFLILIIVD